MEEIVFASEEEKNSLFEQASDSCIEKYPLDILRLILEKLDKDYLMVMFYINKYFSFTVCDEKFWLKQIRDQFGLDRYHLDMIRNSNTYCGIYRKLSDISDPAIELLVRSDVRTKRTKIIDQEIKEVQAQLSLLRVSSGYDKVDKLERKLHTLIRKRDNYIINLKYLEFSFKVDDNMSAFLREVDFGLVNPNDPTSRPIKQMLSVFENGMANHPIIISLFNIYIYNNNLKHTGPGGYIFITVTDEMKRYFHESFESARNNPSRTNRFRNAFKGETVPYGAIHSLVSDNIGIFYGSLHSMASRLSFDKDLLKSVIKVYRGQ